MNYCHHYCHLKLCPLWPSYHFDPPLRKHFIIATYTVGQYTIISILLYLIQLLVVGFSMKAHRLHAQNWQLSIMGAASAITICPVFNLCANNSKNREKKGRSVAQCSLRVTDHPITSGKTGHWSHRSLALPQPSLLQPNRLLPLNRSIADFQGATRLFGCSSIHLIPEQFSSHLLSALFSPSDCVLFCCSVTVYLYSTVVD